jgi:hypothetical protein
MWTILPLQSMGYGITVYPDWMTAWAPETFIWIVSLMIGYFLLGYTLFKMASFIREADDKRSRKRDVTLSAIFMIAAIWAGLELNKNLVLGAIGTMVVLFFEYLFIRFYKKSNDNSPKKITEVKCSELS